MPYRNSNLAKGYSLFAKNPLFETAKNSTLGTLYQNRYSHPLSRYAQNNNGTTTTSNNINSEQSAQQINPEKATTFAQGFDVWKRNFANDMKYIGSSYDKEIAGDNYFKENIDNLKNYFGGEIYSQPDEVIRKKIEKIEDDNYQVPFPSFSPTHQISQTQRVDMKDVHRKELLKDLLSKREAGYSNQQIKEWLEGLYNKGTEATVSHNKVLDEAESLPETEGWGTVGSVAGGVLESLIPVAGGVINPGLGFGLGAASLIKSLTQTIANAHKEIDLYERNTNQSVPKTSRNMYVTGVAATDLLLTALMQSQYLKSIDLPVLGSLRKSLFKRLVNNPKAVGEVSTLLKETAKQTGGLALKQSGASAASSASRNMLSMVYKNPEHYPQLNEIVQDAAHEAIVGAGSGFVTGGISSGLGVLARPQGRSGLQQSGKHSYTSKDVPLPELDGLTRQGWRDRENKIQQIIKDNYIGRRSAQPESSTPPLYRLQLPDERPIVDLGNMTLMEYNALSPQLRAALRDYYLPRPQQGEDSRPPLYKLQLPDEKPLVDLEGLSLREWMERENRIKEILGDKYKPSFIKDVQPSRVSGTNTQDVPLPELDGLTRQGWRDRENKIQQIIKDNYIGRRSAQPESSTPPLYRLQLPDERPIVDLGNMTLMEYNALSPQLRAALRDYYLPRPQQGEDSRPPLYKLQLPDEKPLVDLEGLSLREWMERENRIKEILKENYKPSFLENIKENESRNFIYPSGYNISNSVEAENMAKAMNLKIRRVNDINDLTQQEKKYLDDHSRGKGFYNPETNEVVVIDKNIESDVDFQNTFIQKGVGEKGLQSILGDDMDGFLDDVYNNMTHRESEKYSANGGSSREIALSYISDLVKNPSINPGEWQRLSAYVRNLFRNRYNVQNLSDETVQNLLWRTANQITGDDSIEEMIRKSR